MTENKKKSPREMLEEDYDETTVRIVKTTLNTVARYVREYGSKKGTVDEICKIIKNEVGISNDIN